VAAFVLVVATMVVYWWRVDRPRTHAPLPSPGVTLSTSQPAATSAATPLIGISGSRDPGSPIAGNTAAVSRGTSGQSTPRAPFGERNQSGSTARRTRTANGADGSLERRDRAGRATLKLASEPTDSRRRAGSAASGGIAGTARTSSGALLAGVDVEARSPVLEGRKRAAVTDAKGRYRLDTLPPGTYTVTFRLAATGASRSDVDVVPDVVTSGVDGVLTPGSPASNGR
jgi:hypothetical protein